MKRIFFFILFICVTGEILNSEVTLNGETYTFTRNANNKILKDSNGDTITLDTYNSLINILSRIGDEFMFIRGFK